MGRIIQIENGKTTVYVNGQDIGALTASTDTYYVGVDLNSGSYEKLNPDGTIINLEAGSVANTTYSDIVSMIGSNSLVPGTYYNITDFETVYDQPDYFIDGQSKSIVTTKTATNEPLIVLATSTSSISKQAFQVNTENKIQYDITFSSTEVNGSPAKGRISELIDGNNNRSDYDHVNVEFKRYLNYVRDTQLTGTITDYDCTTGLVVGLGTLFLSEVSPGDILLMDTYANLGYNVGVKVVSISDDTNLYVYVDANYSGTILTLSSYNFYKAGPLGYTSHREIYVAQSDVSDYLEYNTFIDPSLSINNYIGDFAVFKTTEGWPFLLSNNVLDTYCYSNIIGDNSFNNTVGSYFTNNTIGTYFYGNVIGSIFSNNNVGDDFTDNTIGTYFQFNNVDNFFNTNIIDNGFTGNKVGTNCQSNTFGLEFGVGPQKTEGNILGNNLAGNTFGDKAYGNTFGANFVSNTFDDNLISNQIGDFCFNNTVGSDFTNNKIGDFCYNNTIGTNFENNVIGNYFGNSGGSITNTISNYFRYNKIGNYFGNDTNFPTVSGGIGADGGNTINNYFQFNEIGDNFIYNITDLNFNYNKIGNDFWINIFGQNNTNNVIGDLFVGNVGFAGFPNPIGNGFISNQIGNYTPYNKISTNFAYNKIGDFFGNAGIGTENTIKTNFRNNIINNYFGDSGTHTSGGNVVSDNFRLNTVETNTLYGVDFSVSTHVYADYNCTILKASSATNVLSFVSGTTLTIDNVNA